MLFRRSGMYEFEKGKYLSQVRSKGQQSNESRVRYGGEEWRAGGIMNITMTMMLTPSALCAQSRTEIVPPYMTSFRGWSFIVSKPSIQ